MSRFSLGIDIGTSSIKVSLLDIDTATIVGSAVSPGQEMRIVARQPGWAEQDPEEWWTNVVLAVRLLSTTCSHELRSVVCVGLSYQEHGLVLIDDRGAAIRPAIIWCDGRAVATGDRLYGEIGESLCSSRLLNSPANFTASKLAWVKDNEPAHVARAATVLLPGDYIAYRLTGERATTIPGLSEQILYDYSDGTLASFVLDHMIL